MLRVQPALQALTVFPAGLPALLVLPVLPALPAPLVLMVQWEPLVPLVRKVLTLLSPAPLVLRGPLVRLVLRALTLLLSGLRGLRAQLALPVLTLSLLAPLVQRVLVLQARQAPQVRILQSRVRLVLPVQPAPQALTVP